MNFFCITSVLVALAASQLLTYPFVPMPKEGVARKQRSKQVHEGGIVKGILKMSTESLLCDPNVNQYSGYFSITGTNKKYFYWFFESRSDPSASPTVAWLTGGPGCSSMLALFGENGPCSVDKDGASTTPNQFSWNNNANMLWIDQPAGTGFSEGDYDSGEDEVADDMLGFLLAFFEALPKYNKNFYIFGESYAGHYIPAIAHKVYAYNKGQTTDAYKVESFNKDSLIIDFKGVGIGNGLTNPEEQYKWYPTMAFNSTTAPQIVSEDEFNSMQGSVPMCTRLIDTCNMMKLEETVDPANYDTTNTMSNPICYIAMLYCNMNLMKPYSDHGMNPYDMRLKCEKPPLCYDFSEIETYLNDPKVQAALGVDTTNWESCNMQVNLQFMNDFMRNYDDLIPDLLEAGIPVLIYVGDQDYICNWIGNKHWVLDLEWSGKSEMNSASDSSYIRSDGAEIGLLRNAKNIFYFLQFYQAGHMVPMDQPQSALYMFNQFIHGELGVTAAGVSTEESSTVTAIETL